MFFFFIAFELKFYKIKNIFVCPFIFIY